MRDGDSDFEFGDEYSDGDSLSPPPHSGPSATQARVVKNQPHDEEIPLTDDDDDDVDDDHLGAAADRRHRGDSPPPHHGMSDPDDTDYDDNSMEIPGPPQPAVQTYSREPPKRPPSAGAAGGGVAREPSAVSMQLQQQAKGGSGGSSDDGRGDAGGSGSGARSYNAADFEHLQVFALIGRYRPRPLELEPRLKPFIPDYVPAVGDVDPFLKPPRPDGKQDFLGLKVLDEPAARQSDPAVLQLQLRAVSKQSNMQPVTVPSIENAERNPRKIADWIASIGELHRSHPPPQARYKKPFPDIEQLMQEWPPEMEDLLSTVRLPTADLSLDTEAFAKIVCTILDIPVYSNLVDSLHVLFSLYVEFKSNPHFAMAGGF
eukprot:jgi/Chlat1/3789/Chrsp259S03926